jgi:hypothetical protein
MSPKYSLNELDYKKILQTMIFAGASAIIGALILVVADTQFPPEYAVLVPLINTLLYGAKRFFEGSV